MRRFFLVLSLLISCTSGVALEGELLSGDLKRATIALTRLLNEESSRYQLDKNASGCRFDLCTDVVSRVASFTMVTSSPDAHVVRMKRIFCSAPRASANWGCSPPNYLGKVEEFNSREFYVHPEIEDKTVLNLLGFLRSNCIKDLDSVRIDGAATKADLTRRIKVNNFGVLSSVEYNPDKSEYLMTFDKGSSAVLLLKVGAVADDGSCGLRLLGALLRFIAY